MNKVQTSSSLSEMQSSNMVRSNSQYWAFQTVQSVLLASHYLLSFLSHHLRMIHVLSCCAQTQQFNLAQISWSCIKAIHSDINRTFKSSRLSLQSVINHPSNARPCFCLLLSVLKVFFFFCGIVPIYND